MRTLVLLAVAVVSIMTLNPVSTLACSCASPKPPCARMAYDVIFIGRVLDGRLDTIDGRQRMVHTLAVERAVKGIADSHVVVETGIGGGDCGIYFETDTSYVVYGMRHGDRITTGRCSRTARVTWKDDDICYFDLINVQKEWSVLYGRISVRVGHWTGGIAGAKIVVVGAGMRREVRADDYGFYEVVGLPDGNYSVHWEAPEGLTSTPSEVSVTVAGHGCSEVNFVVDESGEG
jgi:hypothetical protein